MQVMSASRETRGPPRGGRVTPEVMQRANVEGTIVSMRLGKNYNRGLYTKSKVMSVNFCTESIPRRVQIGPPLTGVFDIRNGKGLAGLYSGPRLTTPSSDQALSEERESDLCSHVLTAQVV